MKILFILNDAPYGSQKVYNAMRRAAADGGLRLGIFYEERRSTYEDDWSARAEAAKVRPTGARGLDGIVSRILNRGQDHEERC